MTTQTPGSPGRSMIAALALLVSLSCLAADSYPEAAQLPSQEGLPDPLRLFNGTPVTSKSQWVKQRRPELKALFQHYMFGQLPPAPRTVKWTVERVDTNLFGGKATKKEILITLGAAEAPRLHLLLVVPNHRSRPAPAFVGLNFCGNYSVLYDATMPLPTTWMPNSCPGCANNRATDAGRGRDTNSWALEQSIDRGYAVATLYNGDIEPDRPDAPEGVRAWFARNGGGEAGRGSDWGGIAAWAWGLHRAVDYLVTDKDLDPKRIAVFGHSRNGKAALVAAALDERVALAIPHQAGCGGTAPSRGKIGESVKAINEHFPHWFNARFKTFNEQPGRLPFDQHCLIALCAPRPVLLSNATEDTWANPEGQFQMLQAADPVYRLLKVEGLGTRRMPEAGKLIDSKLGYYIRPGKHSTTPADWAVFLDFADRHLR